MRLVVVTYLSFIGASFAGCNASVDAGITVQQGVEDDAGSPVQQGVEDDASTGQFDASVTIDGCYDPTQNAEVVCDPGTVGCACIGGTVGPFCPPPRTSTPTDPEPGSCYSPTQNLDIAYLADSVGCACVGGSMPECIWNNHSGYVALTCRDGHWKSFFDGPCWPEHGDPVPCYSPTKNADIAHTSGALGCVCKDGAAAQCVSGSLGNPVGLACSNGRWSAVPDRCGGDG